MDDDLSVYFWEDWCVGDKPLRHLFPHLSNLKLHFVEGVLPSRDQLSSLSLVSY